MNFISEILQYLLTEWLLISLLMPESNVCSRKVYHCMYLHKINWTCMRQMMPVCIQC